MRPRTAICLLFTLLVTSLLLVPDSFASKLTKREFEKYQNEMGVVLMDVNWGRRWGCAGYENAQLEYLRFTKVEVEKHSKKHAEIDLESPSRLFVNDEFLQYGFLVEPGTYAFVGWSVKVARSMNDVSYMRASEEELKIGDEYPGGTFAVSAGETIYIGNFWLDCYKSPIPWRFYTEKNLVEDHFKQFQRKYNFLDIERMEERLLDTDVYGNSFKP